MADPFTWAAIGIGASVGQGVFGAIGAMQQAQAQAGMYKYQSAIAQLNSEIAKGNRDYALATGETTAFFQGLKNRAQIGQAVARMGSSGVAVGTGSSGEVIESAKYIAGLESATIRNNAAREAYGFSVESTKQTAQAGMYDMAADNASKSGWIGAMSSILGSASSVSTKWSSANTSGLFGDNPFGKATGVSPNISLNY